MADERGFPDIREVLPHREPFLLLSRILDCVPGQYATCELDLTGDEDFFKGHFPAEPVMPGALMIEAMAQAGGYAILCLEDFNGKLGFLVSVEKARFRKKVVPAGRLRLETKIIRISGVFAKASGKAFYEGALAAEAEMTFAIGK